jgi:hypothetical protein
MFQCGDGSVDAYPMAVIFNHECDATSVQQENEGATTAPPPLGGLATGTTATCAFEKFEAASRIDIERSLWIATADVSVGLTVDRPGPPREGPESVCQSRPSIASAQ